MRTIIVTLMALSVTVAAAAQENLNIQRSSSPSGLRIQDTPQRLAGTGENIGNAGANKSEANTSSDTGTAGAIRSAVQIQGNTAIKAKAVNLNAASTGRNSTAGNEVGAIGK